MKTNVHNEVHFHVDYREMERKANQYDQLSLNAVFCCFPIRIIDNEIHSSKSILLQNITHHAT